MRASELRVERWNFVPERKDMAEGVLYISDVYRLAIHLCACGCKSETVTPICGEHYSWKLTENGYGIVTLSPSIGNFSMRCRSHYWIRDNKIIWT